MICTFHVQCYTQFGQNLFLKIDAAEYAMEYVANGTWRYIYTCSSMGPKAYSYYIEHENGLRVGEWQPNSRSLPQCDADVQLQVYDEFREYIAGVPFRTKPFELVFCPHALFPSVKVLPKHSFLLSADLPGVLSTQGVGLLGADERLGCWDPKKVLPLLYIGNSHWQLVLSDAKQLQGVEYKLVVYDLETHRVIRWEDGFNRRMPFLGDGALVSVVPRQTFDWRAAGVAIPLFSLRSERSWGVGDFVDLKQMIDWARHTGLKLIQLLPINDTTQLGGEADSYPYRAISVYALHPMYIRPNWLLSNPADDLLKSFEKRRLLLNKETQVNYQSVNKLKYDFLKRWFKRDGADWLKSKGYDKFYQEQKYWLLPYAVFCVLRDVYGTPHFEQWPEWSHFQVRELEQIAGRYRTEVDYYCLLQYVAQSQLLEARDYAHRKGVVLKGDLPIGISATSVEAWMQPSYFHLDSQAGAPPDAFSEVGQNWGFPTYNWELMAADGYSWWKQRFGMMERFFDAFRIDHILGFFRIWTIPSDAVLGLLGYFDPALPLSLDELQHYGLKGSLKRYTQPYITTEYLAHCFGDKATVVAELFLEATEAYTFCFKKAFATQRAMERYLASTSTSEWSEKEREALLMLYCEVLLIEDCQQKGHYHPRINLQKSYSFSQLSVAEKQLLEQLHDDYFYVRHSEFWRRSALQKLPGLLATTSMLVCGEDLGMLPDCVAPVMSELQILTLEIERMPKNQGYEFTPVDLVPYFSVFSTGTHDMSTLRGWWQENRSVTQRYYNEVLQLKGEAPTDCYPAVAEEVVRHALSANSMLVVLPWQDYMAMSDGKMTLNPTEERINVPANFHQVWNYRMPVTLESLLEHRDFNKHLMDLIHLNGR